MGLDRQPDDWGRSLVLGGEFLDAVRELRDAIGGFDLVCFTGDVAHSGDPKQYAAVTPWLDGVLAAAGCMRAQLFVVPGNHDVQRQINPRAVNSLRKMWSRDNDAKLSAWIAGGGKAPGRMKWAEETMARSAAYRAWLRDGLGRPELVPAPGRLGYRQSVRVPGIDFLVNIFGIDSAWLSADNHDTGQLHLTEEQLMRAATDRSRTLPGFRLGLVHHPLGNLADEQRARRVLANPIHLDLLLRGHLHEAELLDMRSPDGGFIELAAGTLYEHYRYPNGFSGMRLTLDTDGRLVETELHVRSWHNGLWAPENHLYRGMRNGVVVYPPRIRRSGLPRGNGALVGRGTESEQLRAAILSPGVPAVIVTGLPGVGKSYLVAHGAADLKARGTIEDCVRLSFDPRNPATIATLWETLLGELSLPGNVNDDGVRSSLDSRRLLLLVENVDSQPTALIAAALVNRLVGARLPVVITGRFPSLGADSGWQPLALERLARADAIELIESEHRSAADEDERRGFALVASETGDLPLALHIAASHLRAGRTPDEFVALLRHKKLFVSTRDPAEHADAASVPGAAERLVLASTFELSLDLMRDQLALDHRPAEVDAILVGLCALGHAPASGVGRDLARALSALSAPAFSDLVVAAREVSLLERSVDDRISVHPLLAMLLQSRPSVALHPRYRAWFLREFATRSSWPQIARERDALRSWLQSEDPPGRAAIAASPTALGFAHEHGPMGVWVELFEQRLAEFGSDPRSARDAAALASEIAGFYSQSANPAQAVPALRRARALANATGDRVLIDEVRLRTQLFGQGKSGTSSDVRPMLDGLETMLKRPAVTDEAKRLERTLRPYADALRLSLDAERDPGAVARARASIEQLTQSSEFVAMSPGPRAGILDVLANLEARSGDLARAVDRLAIEVEPLLDALEAGQAATVRLRRAEWLEKLGRLQEAKTLAAQIMPMLRDRGLRDELAAATTLHDRL